MPDAAVRRSTVTVDLGAELKAQLQAAAAARGVSPSQWAREVIQRAAAEARTKRGAAQPKPEPEPKQPNAGRLVLDSDLAQLMAEVVRQGQFRSRPAALRLVLRQFLGKEAGEQSQPTDTSALKDGVSALMKSNYELGQVGININQIARAMNSLQGTFRQKDRQNLEVFVTEAREHIARASKVVAAMRKLLTPKRASQ